MKYKRTQQFISLAVLAVFVFTLLVPNVVNANNAPDPQAPRDINSSIIGNLTQTQGTSGLDNPELPVVIGTVIKSVLVFLATLFIVLIIIAGFKWMTAGGNKEQVGSAASLMRNAVIGLLIIIVSYGITFTVFDIILKAT